MLHIKAGALPLRRLPSPLHVDILSLDGRPPVSSGKSQLKAYSWFVEKKDPHAHLFLLKINTWPKEKARSTKFSKS
jgi:hypothetical protein